MPIETFSGACAECCGGGDPCTDCTDLLVTLPTDLLYFETCEFPDSLTLEASGAIECTWGVRFFFDVCPVVAGYDVSMTPDGSNMRLQFQDLGSGDITIYTILAADFVGTSWEFGFVSTTDGGAVNWPSTLQVDCVES